MTAKLFRRYFGLHARRVAVRPQMPWHLRAIAVVFLAAALGGLAWIGYDALLAPVASAGEPADGRMVGLKDDNARLEAEVHGLKSEFSVLERQLQIERATNADLARQVKSLSEENARLREDIALVQAISATDATAEGVKVSSVRVEPNALAGEYNYRIVLLQTGARTKPFQGSYELVVNLVQDGKRTGMTVPAPAERDERAYQLDFRVHQRIDGTFRVEPGAVVRSIQVRVFEGGRSQPKAMQTVTLS
ncbi:MAG: hypothetical protein IT531_11725 [Burkholderiales bacterium]|nr:hypothetical protein [Burkholderiales bacterium]